MTSRVLFLAVTLLLFSSTPFASNKQSEAASLIERAKQLSDIRADGAPAFRLKLDFKATKKDGSVLEGTYTEVWGSKAQWRRETVAGDVRRTEVAEGQKRFLLEPGKALLEQLQGLPALSEIGRLQPEAWKPEKIENRSLDGANVRCVETLPVIRMGMIRLPNSPERKGGGEAPALCFDGTIGVLVAEIEPAMNRSEGEACFFSDYQKFGDRSYARSYKCVKGDQVRLEARVVELAAIPQVDPELFALPEGTKELTSCPDPVRPPRVVYEPEPAAFHGSGVVVILITVGIDGTPRNLSVDSSPSPKLEKTALEAVRQWRFRPATCDREPVEMKIAVEINTQVR
jgi:TonB family protein